ncbi:predicted protein [Uncinocarpus reesii 1704]|uniref:Arabinan endo-1,5-alpha-L-arabinosidase n=1 Tax=Uncinocarpus reesii (strain UAMH 1704) TaxID=336963 RepID=C4JQ75_UNCRE|nr:uncharacterized protein UREG_03308 [Uncinocarpus reesii 1704]EEP78462.1 predicted protein [Uncinocarpus reesii 1704]
MHRDILSLLAATSLCSAVPPPEKPCNPPATYPLTHNSSAIAHDPDILKHEDYYYLLGSGPGIRFSRARSLNGPWEDLGAILDKPSIIPKGDRAKPWAPSSGSNDSAIGVATSKQMKPGSWTDHGALVHTGTGPGSQREPFKGSNAIDPQVFIDPKDGQAYLNYGSYFSGLWQVPLSDDLMSLKYPDKVDGRHLVNKPTGVEENSFITFKDGFYYLWFSYGQCCNFDPGNLPEDGKEYSIRVGRSKNVRGPFVDKCSRELTSGGGHVVYGSNHNKQVYAPGGQGVLPGDPQDILYYHCLNTSVGLEYLDAYMGWSYLEYVDGWPVATSDPV